MSRAYYLVEIFESRTSLAVCLDSVSGNCEAPLGSNPLTSKSEKDTPKKRRANCIIIGTLVSVRNYTLHRAPFISILRELLIPLTLLTKWRMHVLILLIEKFRASCVAFKLSFFFLSRPE